MPKMPMNAHSQATRAPRTSITLPSIAPCGCLRNARGKVKHAEDCTHYVSMKAQQTAQKGGQYSRGPHHSALMSPITTFPESPSFGSASSATGLSTESVASDDSFGLDSRRNSLSITTWSNASARSLQDPHYFDTSMETAGTPNAGKGKKKRIRSEMTTHKSMKADSKNKNEQMKRGDLSAQLRDGEDLQEVWCGISVGAVQAAPNGKSSCLRITKKDNQDNHLSITRYLVEKNLRSHIDDGDENGHFEELQAVVERDRQKRAQGLLPTHRTIMDEGDAPRCENLKDNLHCITHDEPDVRECRKARQKKLMDSKIAMLKAQRQNGGMSTPSHS